MQRTTVNEEFRTFIVRRTVQIVEEYHISATSPLTAKARVKRSLANGEITPTKVRQIRRGHLQV